MQENESRMQFVVRILQYIQQHMTSAALVSGAIGGLLLGLAIGWWLWPVEFTNSTPAQLHADFQKPYLFYIADQYVVTGDIEQAREGLGVTLWDEGELVATLNQLADESGPGDKLAINLLVAALEESPSSPSQPESEEPTDADESGFHTTTLLCGIGILLVAVAAGVAFLIPRLRRNRSLYKEPEDDLGSFVGRGTEILKPRSVEAAEPTGSISAPQFVTTYALGDDQYDPSFTIESDSGEFVGECGVGISETIGLGSPSKATAFEVWLFDKNDVRTVTAILMSEYAFGDTTLRSELSAKGEPLEVRVGAELVLETKSLDLHIRVAEVEYGDGPLPPKSYFSRLTVELSPTVKGGVDGDETQATPLSPRF